MAATNALQIRIDEFKTFHLINDNIAQNFRLEDNGGLSFLYNNNWVLLTKQKDSSKFYAASTLRRHSVDFMRALKLMPSVKVKAAFHVPTMNSLKTELMHDYILDQPVSQVGLHNPLKPIKRALTTKTINFKQTAFTIRNFLKGYELNVPNGYATERDFLTFLQEVQPKIQDVITEEIRNLGGVKFQLGLRILLRKDNEINGSVVYDTPTFYHDQISVMNENEINFENAFATIASRVETWINNGSGWKIERIENLWLNIARYQPLRGASYIELPKTLRDKKAIINVQNEDNNCLRWAIRSALFPADNNPHRTSKYPTNDGLDFTGIDAPTLISQIKKVEKQNNLAINVFGWKGYVIVHQLSQQPSEISRINLMLIEKNEKHGIRTHYTWIKSLSRLLHDQNKNNNPKHFCERCLHGYSRADLLEQHKPECKGNNERAIRIEMPTKEKSILKYENWHKQMKAPFIIYADFESIINKFEGPELKSDESNTLKTQQHEACGFSYIVVRSDGTTEDPFVYRGPNATEMFLQCLEQEEIKIKDFFSKPKPLCMTPEDWDNYNKASCCYVCNKLMERKRAKKTGRLYFDKVRDHCHITGNYRGSAHFSCNLKLRLNPKTTIIPVVFHNLRGYDAHLIMQAISKTQGNITCIPNNMEKYISFSLRQLRFIDSAQFLVASLDKLVKANSSEAFQITSKYEPDKTKQELLLRKGVYPYEYMDSWERFQETKLPPIEEFYSKLTDESISAEDYEHAQKVWNTFACQTLGNYHDLYLRTDVLLLADVFENFRKTCLKQYELDPAHYYTSPGLSWDALLKKTAIQLELLTDYDMHLFIEKGLRGGISMASKRYAKANNALIPNFNPNDKTSYILYLDANNLYGWAMSQYLPTGGFEWVQDHEMQVQYHEILNNLTNADKGYILEVDLEYPSELHTTHNDYPLAPESLEVQNEWLSDYQTKLLGGKKLTQIKKLVPSLRNKTKYVVHYRNLQLYLSLGMRLTKIHRALRFDQKAWMEPYIRMNTELRKQATCDFEKDLYKLMNNSVFGKTMENLRKRVDVKLVRSSEETKLRKLIAKPSFARQKIFDNDLAALHMYKSKLYFNRPVYVGMAILDMSKLLMYDFYYNQIKKQYGDNVCLLYTDTDSLLMQIETDDVYNDIAQHADLYDTSDYPKDHYLYNSKNKKVLGKMKDECAGKPIIEYVGLRPKMYSILTSDGNIRKAKGIKKCVVKKNIIHENYKEALLDQKTFRHGMNMLRSENHQIYGLHVNKISLSPLDTKRWITDNGITTLAYGHKDIR